MLTLRTYREEDYTEVISLWTKAGLILSLSDNKSELQVLADHNPDSFLILEKDSQIIGSVVGAFDGRRGYIHHLAVDPKFQGQGYGKMLMNEITSYFADKEVVKIHLMIEKSNEEVVNFYEEIGWFFRDDLIMMSKVLREGEFSSKINEDG